MPCMAWKQNKPLEYNGLGAKRPCMAWKQNKPLEYNGLGGKRQS